jgi:hypothetical protein
MRGWEIKPIGVLVVLGLLTLLGYTAYQLLLLHHSRDESPPDTQS